MKRVIDYKDGKLKMPSYFSLLAKDFIKCCLRKNPKNRKNIFKLRTHPFVEQMNKNSTKDS